MVRRSIDTLRAAAEEIGEFGLRSLSPKIIAHAAVQSGSIFHMQAALHALVYFHYSDKRQSPDTDFQKFPEYFEKIIDAMAELNPYQAIISCFQNYVASCDAATIDHLNFDKVILPTAAKYLSRLGKEDTVKVILLLGNEQTASNPPTEAPVYYDMLRQLMAQLSRYDKRQARDIARYMLKTYADEPQFPDIFKPYAHPITKRQPGERADCK